MSRSNKIYILDVTNRDGVQTSRLGLAKLEKTMINLYLDEMAVHVSEFGFPITRHEKNYHNANLKLKKMGVLDKIKFVGWIRAVPEDVEMATNSLPIENLSLLASISEQMINGKYKGIMARKDVLGRMVEAVVLAKERGVKEICVNGQDSSRTDEDFIIEFASNAKAHGANRFRYCDTLGFDDPFAIYEKIKFLASEVKIPIEIHCHNDLGMAVACSLAGAKAAIDGGVDAYINTAVNGMGERTGNADLVSVLLALKKLKGFRDRYQIDEKIDLSKSWEIAKYCSYAFGVPIPINQPGVGENAFAHESGIHVDGALKDRYNYELYDYEELGRGEPIIIETGRRITVGEYSGIKGFRNVYHELEIEFKDDKEAT